MSHKEVHVDPHRRSTPNHDKPWTSPGNKPGPKPVKVPEHEREKPKSK